MTRTARWALPLVLALGLAGCDDFLATEPKAELTTGSFFETADQAIHATNATYSMLRHWQVHVFSYLGLTDIVSDDATKGSVPGDAGFLGDLDNLIFDPNNLAFRDPWGGYYQGIYRANVAIANIPNISMDTGLRAQLVAENKFLRSYFYFFLVRNWGGVPLITAPLTPDEFGQPRASAEQVWAQIEQDLTEAIPDLPTVAEQPANDVGRATRGAAQALLAKVHLFQDEYAEAQARAEDVIESGHYSLGADYGEIFTESGENGPGSIFEVQLLALEGGNAGPGGASSQYSEVQGIRSETNTGWGFNTASPDLEASYEPGDPRLHATILYPWELLPDGTGQLVWLNDAMPNSRYNQKVFRSPTNPGGNNNTPMNIRVIRYADVLLIAAEAAYRQGDEGTARGYVNQVRERARGDRTRTLGLHVETLSDSIATMVLGLATDSRVSVRYVNPNSAASAAGVQSFESERDADVEPLPIRVENLDIIEAVNGIPVSTVAEYEAAVEAAGLGATVVNITRVEHPEGGSPTTTPVVATVPVMALLPPVTATGSELLDAIWEERRHELAMEQHRWSDIVRQGRAAELMEALTCEDRAQEPGCAPIVFDAGQDLFPIPAIEVTVAGLEQNPGY